MAIKVLFITSGNTKNIFVKEQADSLIKCGIDVKFFYIYGRGAAGYLSCLHDLKQYIVVYRPTIIHAHYSLSGILSNLQRNIPVITTYQGCDINRSSLRILSLIAIFLSRKNIFVSKELQTKVRLFNKKTHETIPRGVDTKIFFQSNQDKCRKHLNLNLKKRYVLFSSNFLVAVKNSRLALKAVEMLDEEVELLELKGFTREEVNLLMNACDVGLLTSIREGSPNFIKELMSVNRQIVATDVGDVKRVLGNIPGCYLAGFDPKDVADKISLAIKHSRTYGRTQGRERIFQLGLDSETIADRIHQIYHQVLSES